MEIENEIEFGNSERFSLAKRQLIFFAILLALIGGSIAAEQNRIKTTA